MDNKACSLNPKKCPHGWTECELCLYKMPCDLGVYEPNLEPEKPKEEVPKPIKKVVNSTPENMIKSSPRQFWIIWGSMKRSSDLRVVDSLTGGGASKKGGGSKSKRHKNPPKKMAEYLKTWGT